MLLPTLPEIKAGIQFGKDAMSGTMPKLERIIHEARQEGPFLRVQPRGATPTRGVRETSGLRGHDVSPTVSDEQVKAFAKDPNNHVKQRANAYTTEKLAKELRIRQRAVSRCKKGSKSRKKKVKQVSLLHLKIRNTRNTYLHQVSARLVKDYDLIAVEKLNMKGLTQGILAKQIHDAGWGKLRQYIAYKAEGAGRTMVEVDPKYTSQICPGCGVIKKKDLSERVHSCTDCGLVLDRDHAAALVILNRAVVRPGVGNVTGYGEHGLGIRLEGISN